MKQNKVMGIKKEYAVLWTNIADRIMYDHMRVVDAQKFLKQALADGRAKLMKVL